MNRSWLEHVACIIVQSKRIVLSSFWLFSLHGCLGWSHRAHRTFLKKFNVQHITRRRNISHFLYRRAAGPSAGLGLKKLSGCHFRNNCALFLRGEWRGLTETAPEELDAANRAANTSSPGQQPTTAFDTQQKQAEVLEEARKLNYSKAMHMLKSTNVALGDV